jgi:hypothetical protein
LSDSTSTSPKILISLSDSTSTSPKQILPQLPLRRSWCTHY